MARSLSIISRLAVAAIAASLTVAAATAILAWRSQVEAWVAATTQPEGPVVVLNGDDKFVRFPAGTTAAEIARRFDHWLVLVNSGQVLDWTEACQRHVASVATLPSPPPGYVLPSPGPDGSPPVLEYEPPGGYWEFIPQGESAKHCLVYRKEQVPLPVAYVYNEYGPPETQVLLSRTSLLDSEAAKQLSEETTGYVAAARRAGRLPEPAKRPSIGKMLRASRVPALVTLCLLCLYVSWMWAARFLSS